MNALFEAKEKEEFITDSVRSAYLKIFLNYIQLVSISKGLDLKWSEFILDFFNINLLLSGSMFKVLSIDCLFPGTKMVYFNALVSSLVPFFLFVLIFFIWFCISRFKIEIFAQNMNKIITSLAITIFTLQPGIINALLSMISCKEIDKNKFYISSYLTEECSTEAHHLWTSLLFYPAFIFYVILLPALPFFYILVFRNNLYVNDRFKKVGFLFSGYMKKKFYWEFIFFYRKIIIIVIIHYVSINVPTKSLIILSILLASLFLQAMENPYIGEDLNSLDFKATFVAFLTIFGGLIAFSSSSNNSQILVSIIILLANILYIYQWGRKFIIQYLPFYMKNKYCKCLSKYLIKLQPEYDALLTQRRNFGIMGISSDKSSNLGNVPKRSSFFMNFKNAFSNVIAEPISPFKSKKKLKEPDFSFKTFSDFHSRMKPFRDKQEKDLGIELSFSNKPNPLSSKFKPMQSNSNIKSTPRLLSMTNIEEENSEKKDDVEHLKEIIKLQSKEIEFLNSKIERMKEKLKNLKNENVSKKNNMLDYLSRKLELEDSVYTKNTPHEFNTNAKSSYFDQSSSDRRKELERDFISNYDSQMIERNYEISKNKISESWALRSDLFEFNNLNSFTLNIKKMPFNVKNPSFAKILVEFRNLSFESFKDFTLENESDGDLLVCENFLKEIEVYPKQNVTQIIFMKKIKEKKEKVMYIRCSFKTKTEAYKITIFLPEIEKMYLDWLKVCREKYNTLYDKYCEEVFSKIYNISDKIILRFSDIQKIYPKLNWENESKTSLIGKMRCFYDNKTIKFILIIKDKTDEKQTPSLEIKIFSKNDANGRIFKDKYPIEENIVFYFFESIIILTRF